MLSIIKVVLYIDFGQTSAISDVYTFCGPEVFVGLTSKWPNSFDCSYQGSLFRDASTEYYSDFAPSFYGCQSSITGYITCINQTLGTIRNAPNFTWRTRGPSQTTCDSNTHYTPLRYCSGAVKAASANVSQMINLCVIKHCERDIPLTICCLNARSVKNKAL